MDWLNFLLRWAHLIAGIAWIGNSFYFMWLDSHLEAPEGDDPDVFGSLWMVHSGGFYTVQKRKIHAGKMPKILHWFKWEATFTWATGFFLLGVVYYLSGGVFLIEADSSLTLSTAVFLSLGILAFTWVAYDLFMESRLSHSPWFSQPILAAAILGLAFALNHFFTGRAAFIHLGAIFGTIMVANVWMRILPAQIKMIAATDRGEKPDYSAGQNAKRRSTHNSYLTLPVLITMLSNHYSNFYGSPYRVVILILLVIFGMSIRHLMLKGKSGTWALGPGLVSLFSVMILTYPKAATLPSGSMQNQLTAPSFAQVSQIFKNRCISCHSKNPSDKTFISAIGGVYFDEPGQIKKYAPRVLVRVFETKTMPLANKTNITEEERTQLAAWVRAGAPIE